MRQYHNLLKNILNNGEVGFEPRTEMHILGLPGAQSIYDFSLGFPQLTTKNVPIRLPGEEVFWKTRGERNVKSLFDRKVHIWDANAFDHWLKLKGLKDEYPKHSSAWTNGFVEFKRKLKEGSHSVGDLGPVYGYQWRHGFKRNGEEIDQLNNVIVGIKSNPISRYHLMTAWNPSDLPDQAIGPCPMTHQFTSFGKILHLNVYQRSCDAYLGVPFNISQDSLLLSMIAKESGQEVGKFVHSYGNVHIYLGVSPRSDFWDEEDNIDLFRQKLSGIEKKSDFMRLRDWYLNSAGGEGEGQERKDHMPFVLEQLSKPLRRRPSLNLENIPFFEAIKMPLGDVASLRGYNPHKWDSKAIMAT